MNKRRQKPTSSRTKGKCNKAQCVAVMPHLKLWDIKGLADFWRGNTIRPGRGREMSRNARTRLKKRRVPTCDRRWSKALQPWHLGDGAPLLDVPVSPLASAMKGSERL